ncbi:VMO1 protein, partial [Pitta sordida]|nr:VMO1 protein [Pitta sordida]
PAMLLLILAIFGLQSYCCLQGTEARKYESMLMMPNGEPWGSWRHTQFCPSGYAKGFELKVQPYQGFWLFADDTALNGIRLLCTDGTVIESSVSWWRNWTKAQVCSSNQLVAFSLRVERWQYFRDNMAVNNVRFACLNGTMLEGWRLSGGCFGPWSSNCTSGAICGLQTKVEVPQGKGDDTALSDMRVFCCQ